MIVFPLIRSDGLKAATASSRAATFVEGYSQEGCRARFSSFFNNSKIFFINATGAARLFLRVVVH